MEIRHLKYFVAMAEAGSLMKASERLRVAQPALSVHLSNLEMDLGVRLVNRSNRGIELTEEGELLYERATQLLRYHEDAIASLKAKRVSPSGSVSLGLPSTLPGIVTPALYRALRDRLPDVRLYVVEASTAVLHEWLQDGKIDYAILFNIPESAGLHITPLYIEDFCLVGRPGGERSSKTVEFEELFEYSLMLPCSATSWRKILDAAADARGCSFGSPIETESTSALRAAALAGDCHVIMPRTSVCEEIARGELEARRIVNPDIKGLKSLVHIENRMMTAAQRETGRLVTEVIKNELTKLDTDMCVADTKALTLISPSALFPKGGWRGHPAHREAGSLVQ